VSTPHCNLLPKISQLTYAKMSWLAVYWSVSNTRTRLLAGAYGRLVPRISYETLFESKHVGNAIYYYVLSSSLLLSSLELSDKKVYEP
jgi:hypothetical protein